MIKKFIPMSITPTPRQILETLLPHLRVAASYARFLQPKIAVLPDKDTTDGNSFTAALTDADLAIQNFVEVAILGSFPNIRFYGEEYQSSPNTKYFRAIDLGEQDDYLVTLDPIDGTKYYMDGHSNYQIILTVLNADDYEAVLAISPAQNVYFYALRGEGAFKGQLDMSLEECSPLTVNLNPEPTILLGTKMAALAPTLKNKYQVIDLNIDYSTSVQVPNLNGMLAGLLSGAVKQKGQFIDGGALAFLAREAGFIVTTLDGSPLPPLHTCKNYCLPGLIIATSKTVHQDLLEATSIVEMRS